MHGRDAARARDARMMNGVMALGGRSASAFEVDLALGREPLPVPSSRLWSRLRAFFMRGGQERRASQGAAVAPAMGLKLNP